VEAGPGGKALTYRRGGNLFLFGGDVAATQLCLAEKGVGFLNDRRGLYNSPKGFRAIDVHFFPIKT